LMIKELVQVQMRVQGFDQVGATLVALGGRDVKLQCLLLNMDSS
jgi:hypothetical protein